MKRRGAFTLVEVSIAMVIGIFLLLGVWALYRTGYRSFRKVDANTEAVLSASIITTVISDDLRNLTLTKDDLKAGNNHSIPFKVTESNRQLVGKLGTKEPVLLSKGPFKIRITDPEGSLKSTPEINVIDVEYSLQKVNTGGKDLYQFARKGKGGDTRVYRESYCKEVAFTFLHTKEDAKDVTEPAPGDEQVVYCRLTVVGASTSLMEGASGSPDANSDWYQIPVVSLFALDCISEIMTARGLGRFWKPVQLGTGTPTNP
jgi:hypothetical protein